MLRSLIIRSSGIVSQQVLFKNLLTRGCVYGPWDVRRSMVFSSCLFTSNSFEDNSRRQFNYNTRDFLCLKGSQNEEDRKKIHYSSKKFGNIKLESLDINKAQNEFFKIKMNDLKDAPLSAFWIGFGGLIPFVFPPLQSMVFGYSPMLASLQLAYGTAILSFVGGCQWGYLVPNKEMKSWEKYAVSILPSLLATLSILLPKLVAFPLVIFGLIGTFFLDLTTSNYPKWFLSLRGVLTNISVFFLLISFLQTLLRF